MPFTTNEPCTPTEKYAKVRWLLRLGFWDRGVAG